MSNFSLDTEYAAIHSQYLAALELLDERRTALIKQIIGWLNDKTIELSVVNDTSTDEGLQNFATKYRAYHCQEYKKALDSKHFLKGEIEALNAFQNSRDALLAILDNNQNISEKTRVAVRELITYIDQYIEPSLWNTLFRKTSWSMLVGALNETRVLLEKKVAIESTDFEAFNTYNDYLNSVDGRPVTEPCDYEGAILIMPLLLPLVRGFDIGFFTGGILCPALGLVIGLAVSLFFLYFIIQMRSHTGLSKKMLNVADAESEFVENAKRVQLNIAYCREKTRLTEEHSILTAVISFIDTMYAETDPAKSIELLGLVKEMLLAKKQDELDQATNKLIRSFEKNTYSSFFVNVFKSEKTEFEKSVELLAGNLQTAIRAQDERLRIQIAELVWPSSS